MRDDIDPDAARFDLRDVVRRKRAALAASTLAAALAHPRPEAVPFTYAPGLRRRWVFIDNHWRYSWLNHLYIHPDGTCVPAELADPRAYRARHLAPLEHPTPEGHLVG